MSWYEDKIKKHPQYTSAKRVADLDALYPPFALCVLKIFAIGRKEGLPLCIFETYRSQGRQLELFNKGASKLKTNGMHHFGVATDIIFLDDKNNPSWNEKCNWKRLGEIGKSMDLIWGGDWPWDKPHFQLIPATFTEQQKIVKGVYPSYDLTANQYLEDLLFLYKNSQANKFSVDSITEMVSYIENIGKKKQEPKINEKVFFTPVEVSSKLPDTKQAPAQVKTDFIKVGFGLVVSVIRMFFKKMK